MTDRLTDKEIEEMREVCEDMREDAALDSQIWSPREVMRLLDEVERLREENSKLEKDVKNHRYWEMVDDPECPFF